MELTRLKLPPGLHIKNSCPGHCKNTFKIVENTSADVLQLMNDESRKNDFIKKGHLWAKSLDIQIIKQIWLDLFL